MDDQTLKVYFFGDSICFGQGVSTHLGWVPRLSARFHDIGAKRGRRIEVGNLSINGYTTRQALERMPYDIQSHEPEMLVVQFGMNDCNYWESDRGNPRVSGEAFAANLTEIVRRAHSFGARRVFLHTNHPSPRDADQLPHSNVTYRESNARYNRIIRDVASDLGDLVALNDIEQIWSDQTGGDRERLCELLLPDLLHLSEAGHELYFQTLAEPLEVAVEQLLSDERP